MRKLAIVMTLAIIMCAGFAQAQVNVTVDPATMTFGYMNVFELDGTTFMFGSGWGQADLVAIWAGPEVTLSPNTIGDPNEYWYQCIGLPGQVAPDCGMPGAPGNKSMEAIMHAQVDDGSLSGTTVTFSGNVIANSFTTAHEVVAFIRDFAPDYSSFTETAIPLSATGYFSVSHATDADPARHVQYGFRTTGENVWVTDTAPFGSMTIGPELPVATDDATWGALKSQYR